MQQDKSTKKTEQIGKSVSSEEQLSISITEVIKLFKLPTGKKDINYQKRSGVIVSTVLIVLLLLPFVGASNIASFFVKSLNKTRQGEKDVFYRFKNNPLVNWRNLLFLIAVRFNYLISQTDSGFEDATQKSKKIKAIIFDDSLMKKTGSSIEGVGYVHNHGNDIHVLGFKILVCGFWDGSSFIPVDFSIHRENKSSRIENLQARLAKKTLKKKAILLDIKNIADKKKSISKEVRSLRKDLRQKETKTKMSKLEAKKITSLKLANRSLKKKRELQIICADIIGIENEIFELKSNFCGLKPEEYRKQFKKTRKRNSPGYKREKERDTSKMDSSVKMLKRVVKKGFSPDYVLIDTWFFCKKMIEAVIESPAGIHLVSMARIGIAKYKDIKTGRFYTPKELIVKNERKNAKYSRKYKAKYICLYAEYQGIKIKIFLIKFGKGRWRMLVTTDLKMSFTRIIEIYKIRWTIEVFFKECKQHLLLGKSMSQDFDSQIADATLSLIRYIMLSYYQRLHYGTTIGGMFSVLSQQASKENILTGIRELLTELFEIFAEINGTDYFSAYEDLLRSEKAHPLLVKLGWETENLAA